MPMDKTTLPAIVPPSKLPPVAAPFPLEPMLRLEQVLGLVGFSRSTLYARIDAEEFPAPVKNGRMSMWPAESIRAWISDPSNFTSFVAAKTAPSRGLAKSTVFGPMAAQFAQAETALENFVLFMLLQNFKKAQAVNKVSQYDVKAAEAVEARLAELKTGAPGNIPILKRWRPARRA